MKHILVLVALLAVQCEAALTISNAPPSSITDTSAVVGAFVLTTNSALPTLVAYFGSVNGLTSTVSWSLSKSISTASATGTLQSVTLTNLTPGVWFVNVRALEGSEAAWGATNMSFVVTGTVIRASVFATSIRMTNEFTAGTKVAATDDGTNWYYRTP